MKKSVLAVMAFAMVALLGIGTVSAFGMGFGLNEQDREFAEANREAMQNAIETGNYAEWEGLMQERLAMVEDNIHEETFNKMRERHENREEFRAAVDELRASDGFSREAMEELRAEYGIEGKGLGRGQGFRQGSGKGLGMGEGHGNCPFA